MPSLFLPGLHLALTAQIDIPGRIRTFRRKPTAICIEIARIPLRSLRSVARRAFLHTAARWRSGDVEDCKSSHAGSIPARASNFFAAKLQKCSILQIEHLPAPTRWEFIGQMEMAPGALHNVLPERLGRQHAPADAFMQSCRHCDGMAPTIPPPHSQPSLHTRHQSCRTKNRGSHWRRRSVITPERELHPPAQSGSASPPIPGQVQS